MLCRSTTSGLAGAAPRGLMCGSITGTLARGGVGSMEEQGDAVSSLWNSSTPKAGRRIKDAEMCPWKLPDPASRYSRPFHRFGASHLGSGRGSSRANGTSKPWIHWRLALHGMPPRSNSPAAPAPPLSLPEAERGKGDSRERDRAAVGEMRFR
ncbi:unnamed protein product [Miscanthus lutarioriparius]|uniref:Uncharacterized protein n=1 Tax=Miscanthus lutarioriparius TaxID=422564 RepID=A0A811RL03_9POAL|nr:unnamed protein product [Miscanthus lutarioriparius]